MVVWDQDGSALSAARVASATSSDVERGKVVITWPVAGLTVSNEALDAAGWKMPLM